MASNVVELPRGTFFSRIHSEADFDGADIMMTIVLLEAKHTAHQSETLHVQIIAGIVLLHAEAAHRLHMLQTRMLQRIDADREVQNIEEGIPLAIEDGRDLHLEDIPLVERSASDLLFHDHGVIPGRQYLVPGLHFQ